jgi:4-deoxy-L-threo-5-hexosulose-uronate ketol-isomerase
MPMFRKTFHATHPDMMDGVGNDELRSRYLVEGMFADGEINLNYSHNERFVIGGVVPKGQALRLPEQTEPPSAKGRPFLERREMAAVNIGGAGAITVDGQRFEMGNKECLYVPMGSAEVSFEGDGARFYLASLPAHRACRSSTSPSTRPTRSRAATWPIRTSGRSTSWSFPASATARSCCSG